MIEYLFRAFKATIKLSFIFVEGKSNRNLTELSIMLI